MCKILSKRKENHHWHSLKIWKLYIEKKPHLFPEKKDSLDQMVTPEAQHREKKELFLVFVFICFVVVVVVVLFFLV